MTDEGRETVFTATGTPRGREQGGGDGAGALGTRDVRINYVGPVIGAHSGPGTLALFYLGTER